MAKATGSMMLRIPALLLAAALGAGCAGSPPAPTVPAAAMPAAAPNTVPGPAGALQTGVVLGRSERLLVYQPVARETLASIARRYLGDAKQAWQIAQANNDTWVVEAGTPLVVPLRASNPLGVAAQGWQGVVVLAYHRLGAPASKMTVTAERFEAQLEWLLAQHYQVLRLSDMQAFLAGKQAVPRKAVVLTFDDGYESVYRLAFPLLKKHSLPATVFVYTDFIGARDALSWAQIQEMQRSGLVDIQAHSKTHANLVERSAGEGDAAYRQRLDTELRQARSVIERNLAPLPVKVRQFAFPYGDANAPVLDALQRNGYELGLTVNAGSNPFYTWPLLLKRTMILGDHDLNAFKARVQPARAPMRP